MKIRLFQELFASNEEFGHVILGLEHMEHAYLFPVPGVLAFKMEVAAAKMGAALWLGISFAVFSQCSM
jgi:hypothetical protein